MTIASIPLAVGMTDVDLVQVNFSRFFPWMDHAFLALLRTLGHPLSAILKSGYANPAVDARCNYLRPVRLDDRFTASAAVTTAGATSFVGGFRFEDDRGLFAFGAITFVWIETATMRPRPVPDWIRGAVHPDFLPRKAQ